MKEYKKQNKKEKSRTLILKNILPCLAENLPGK